VFTRCGWSSPRDCWASTPPHGLRERPSLALMPLPHTCASDTSMPPETSTNLEMAIAMPGNLR
jgi:hypothetical protein